MSALAPQATAPPAATGLENASLYVGDLDHNVNENQLYDIFNQVSQVVSIRVCRDQNRRSSLGYAYVNFSNPLDAATAMETLNFTPINGKPIRIMFSHRNPSFRKSGLGNVFIKNLDLSIDNQALYEIFATFGNVLSCKVAVDRNGQSKGYGFAQFENEQSAQNAINKLNGMLLNDKQVYVGAFVRRQERARATGSPIFTNVYVKNLPETTTEEDLKTIFGLYGTITSALVMRDQTGKSRCFGFVNFESPDSAADAVRKLDGSTLNDNKILYVGRAQRKPEREAELRDKFKQERLSRYEKLQGANLYLKNLDDSINDEKLKELFSGFGSITSCKVMVDSQGVSKGSGFVAFSSPEEATKALNEMNGKIVGRKPLYVALAQRKDERRARLQAHFAQIRAPGGLSPFPSGISSYHAGAPRLGPQQMYFSQGTPALLHPQLAGCGFRQQILPGMHPAVGPNFIMPYPLQRQGQPGQHIGLRRGANAQWRQQQQNSNQGYRYMADIGRNGMDQSAAPQVLVGPMMPLAVAASGMPIAPTDVQRQGPLRISTLTSALASASPVERTIMLGEQLYPLVERVEAGHAAKLTGMLLEMDQTEVLHLIESPDALKKKVGEAMEVLRQSAAAEGNMEDQLGSLSLNE